MRTHHGLLAIVLIVIAAPFPVVSLVSGATIAREHFDYTTEASLNAQGSGVGWGGPWSGSSLFGIAAGSLPDPTGMLSPTGNHVSSFASDANKDVNRDLSTPVGTPGTTAYFAWLLRPEGSLGEGFDHGHLGLILSAGPLTSDDLFIGRPGAASPEYPYVLENVGGANQHASSVVPMLNQTILMVLRADFSSGVDTFRLFINPPGDGVEPATASVTKSDLNVGFISRLYIAGPGAFAIDELRVGTTYATVTDNGVPEPSALAACAVGVAIAARTRHRRGAARPSVALKF